MLAKEIPYQPVAYETNTLDTVCSYCSTPLIGLLDVIGGDMEMHDLLDERITVKVHAEHLDDQRRKRLLASVWLNERPVVVVWMAGRELDDFHLHAIVDEPGYHQLLTVAREIVTRRMEGDRREEWSSQAEVEIGDPFEFYGGTILPGKVSFDPSEFKPKYMKPMVPHVA